ncbi:MAG: Hsp20/alpha crystallin family protein [Candidatus Rokuibacteriota bacterium]
MPEHGQPVPLRVYRTDDLLVLAAPMPGLEPADIRVSITGDRVTIHGEERGPHQRERDLVLAEWAIGPYHREVTLPQAVNGALTNVTYGNGVLVLSMPKAEGGRPATNAEIRLEVIAATRGARVAHTGRNIRPTTTTEHRRAQRQAAGGGRDTAGSGR